MTSLRVIVAPLAQSLISQAKATNAATEGATVDTGHCHLVGLIHGAEKLRESVKLRVTRRLSLADWRAPFAQVHPRAENPPISYDDDARDGLIFTYTPNHRYDIRDHAGC